MNSLAGGETPPTVPWDRPEQDPTFQQADVVTSWLTVRSMYPFKKTGDTLASSLQRAWKTFLAHERRELLELLLEAWLQLLEDGVLRGDGWKGLGFTALARRVGKTYEHRSQYWQVGSRWYEELQRAVHDTARRCFPADQAGANAWEDAFFANDRVTTGKMCRLSDEEFKHVVAELEAAPAHLASRRAALTAARLPTSWALPTADALFLHAHDAFSSPSSRFKRFRSFVHALVVVYRRAAADRPHYEPAVGHLESVHGGLASAQQAGAFAALRLELQVSAVDHARDLVFDACKRLQEGRELLRSQRLVDLLEAALFGHRPALAAPADLVSTLAFPFHNEAHRRDVADVFPGHELVLPERAPRSLGRRETSRFFPESRSSAW